MCIYRKTRTIVKGIVDEWREKQEFVADDKVNGCGKGQSEGLFKGFLLVSRDLKVNLYGIAARYIVMV